MTVLRFAQKEDLSKILKLYTHLSKEKNPIPMLDSKLLELYNRILNTPNYYIIPAEIEGIKVLGTILTTKLPLFSCCEVFMASIFYSIFR